MRHTYVLPAHAGMIPKEEMERLIKDGAPRACGDDSDGELTPDMHAVCSPRMRG